MTPTTLRKALIKKGYSETSADFITAQWMEDPTRTQYGTEEQTTADVLDVLKGSRPCRILRFFSDGRPPKRVKVVSSLELAKLHCKSPLTKGVLRSGVKWFDGYREVKS